MFFCQHRAHIWGQHCHALPMIRIRSASHFKELTMSCARHSVCPLRQETAHRGVWKVFEATALILSQETHGHSRWPGWTVISEDIYTTQQLAFLFFFLAKSLTRNNTRKRGIKPDQALSFVFKAFAPAAQNLTRWTQMHLISMQRCGTSLSKVKYVLYAFVCNCTQWTQVKRCATVGCCQRSCRRPWVNRQGSCQAKTPMDRCSTALGSAVHIIHII